ncbi:ABC transporter permease [Aquabacterium lacunae]|uniref:ABC transporter permease n=2 Tax=Aquabacterium lacunae TaxID=2528630 RepID=A0A4Q9GVV2_9BURK|nr:ABC transporter permease [Aquabacterium lacunae]
MLAHGARASTHAATSSSVPSPASSLAPPPRVTARRRTPWVQNERFLRVAVPAMVGVLLLGLWECLVRAFNVPEYLVPGPLRIAQALHDDFGLLMKALWTTLCITAGAFFVATVIGTLVAFAFVQSRWVELSFFPYAVLLQVTPIAAIAPLIIIWVKQPTAALVVCATLIALFPIIANTTLGLRSVSPGLAAFFRMQGASRWQTLVRLQIPGALPYWFAGLRISSGLSLVGAVVAEFVAGTGGQGAGLAYEILQAGYQLNIPRMFAALGLISAAGVALFWLMLGLNQWALRGWHDSATPQEH